MFRVTILALILSTTTVSAETYYSGSGWTIYKNESDCSFLANFDRGTRLWIGYDVGLNRATFVITDPAFKSVTNGKTYDLSLYFRKGSKMDSGWGKIKVFGVRVGDDNGVRFPLNGTDALDDFAASDLIGLMRDDVVVESLLVRETTLAVAKLRACARVVNRENPSDPLAGAESSK